MDQMKALVVDDEPLARERLSRLLGEAGWLVADELGDGVALLEWLKEPKDVDAIFLDIQMPGLSGIEVLAEAEVTPPVVFVTAYSEFAVRAFELAAADYLLKPVFEDRLAKCLQRIRDRLVRPLSPSELKVLLPPPARFAIKAGDGEIFMDLERISHFELDNNHVWACRAPDRYLTRWTTLSEVEQAFPEENLLRIQRNLLLRPQAVKGIRSASVGRIRVLVSPKVELTVSRAMTPRVRATIHEKILGG